MATNSIPSRGAKLLAVADAENDFFIYRDLSKTGDKRPATDFDRVVSSGTIVSDNTGSPWLVVYGYKYNRKIATGYILIDDSGIIWEDQPIESAQIPTVPGSVRINLLPGGKKVLSWAPVSGAAVEIEVSQSFNGPYERVAVFNDEGRDYPITEPTNGKGIYYRLRSSNDYADSAYSRPVHVVADCESNAEPVVTRKVNAQPESYAAVVETENVQTANPSAEEPILGLMRDNIRTVLLVGAGIIMALMMMVIARR